MGCFDEANAYLQTLFIKSADSDDLHSLKPLLHMAMLYGFIDDAGLLFDKLKKLKAIKPGHNTDLERVYLLLRELRLDQSTMVAAILAIKKFIFSQDVVIPTYSFSYNFEYDIFIELKCICFVDDIELLARMDNIIDDMLIQMEVEIDPALINLCVSCRPYNLSYGIG
ncbi:hypothetical protein JQU52_05520 [Paralysiella testudinis]|uniref:Uncharacterized protein n=2 Tax=Paralysiella testudinis TaxID=2809020 RepID=A0A892ZLH2_9NEIS|nr:hypothetical protein JQU52_05520 [Paralysiella testudinis]